MDKKDKYYEDALEIDDYLEDSNETTLINTTVLVETLNKSVGNGKDLKGLHDDLVTQNKLIPLTGQDYLKSLEINGWYGNSINYSDCTIINTMMNLGITTIVSFDGDFDKINGYNVISSI